MFGCLCLKLDGIYVGLPVEVSLSEFIRDVDIVLQGNQLTRAFLNPEPAICTKRGKLTASEWQMIIHTFFIYNSRFCAKWLILLWKA